MQYRLLGKQWCQRAVRINTKRGLGASGREGFSKIFLQPLSAKAAAENAKRNISLTSALAPAATTEARRHWRRV